MKSSFGDRVSPGLDRVLRWTVVLFCALLLAMLWSGLRYQFSFERNSAIERRQIENNNLARLFEEHVRRTLASADITLRQLETEYQLHGPRFDLGAYFAARRDELAPYSGLSVLDEHGTLVLTTTPGTKGQNYAALENFQFHLHNPTRDIFIARPRLGVVRKQQTVFLSRRMNKPDGSFAGTTGLSMDTDYFSNFYNQIDLGPDSVVALIGTDGIVRARRSNVADSGDVPLLDMSDTLLFRKLLPRSDHGQYIGLGSPIDRVSRLISYRVVRNQPLVVVVGTSMAAALANVEQQKKVLFGAGGVISILIVAFAALILSQLSRNARIMRKLRASDERYALLEAAANDGMWDMDLLTRRTYLSPRAKAILGYGEDELENLPEVFMDLVHPDDRRRVRAMETKSIRQGARFEMEYRVRHRDGNYRWILVRGDVVHDEAGRAVRLLGTDTDITERKFAEGQIAEQARLLDLIFRHSADSLVLLDRDYNFVRVSDSYARYHRREVSSFGGLNHFKVYPSDFEQELERCRRERRACSWLSREYQSQDYPERGRTYWDIVAVPILDGDGEIEFFLISFRDVTDRVRAEERNTGFIERIRALSGRLVAIQEAERLAIARELHDEVGQQLTAVKIHLQAMALTSRDSESVFYGDNMNEALHAVSRALEQVRGLSLNLRPMLLDDLGLAVALASLIERDAEAAGWTVHFDERIGSERMDAKVELACYRVAQEALTNVMRHSGATEVWITLERTGRTLLLEVRDNGSGFDLAPDRASPAAPHLGVLGMEERVLNVGGSLEISSPVGMGTIVRASFVIQTPGPTSRPPASTVET